jgi:hypothetical protein
MAVEIFELLNKISSNSKIVSIQGEGFCFEVSTSHAVEQRVV